MTLRMIDGGGCEVSVEERAARLAAVIREEVGDLPPCDEFRVAVERYVVHLDRLAGQAPFRLAKREKDG